MRNDNNQALEDLEISMLLEAIFKWYGYDFRDYAPASLRRRIWHCIRQEGLQTISGLQEKLLHDPSGMADFLDIISIRVTSMFRDPAFYIAFRGKGIPLLQHLPYIRLWHAGCSTGEEVYSLAILLKEEGLYNRTRIYATDLSQAALQKANEGIFPLKAMKDNSVGYLLAGGRTSLSDYLVAGYGHAQIDPSLKKNITWAQHNLVTDGSFNEFNVIFCRNVMIYFNKSLQARVHRLIYESLAVLGILGLGSKESLKFSPLEDSYEALDESQKIYRKVK